MFGFCKALPRIIRRSGLRAFLKSLQGILPIRRQGAFHDDYYRDENPDLITYHGSLLLHYLYDGGYEERDPGPDFDTKYYLKMNPDVEKSGVNPLVHYVLYGKAEGRPTHRARQCATRRFTPPPYTFQQLKALHNASRIPREIPGNPLVSIIILTRNGRENLMRLLSSMERAAFYQNYELLLIDNATDLPEDAAYLEELKKQPRITVLRNEQNVSFSRGCNQGAAAARGDWLLFLNDDVEVTDGWLEELLFTAGTDSACGAVGCRLLFPDYGDEKLPSLRIQHGGVAFRGTFKTNTGEFLAYHRERDQLPELEGVPVIRQMAAVTAAVMLVSRAAYTTVGGFCEEYNYGYEDVDFCLALHTAGYHNLYTSGTLLVHHESLTQRKDAAAAIRERRLQNQQLLERRWGSTIRSGLQRDLAEGTRLFREGPPVVAFAVTEAGADAKAGDFFTASELAAALEKKGFVTRYLCQKDTENDWYQVGEDVDILISMLDAYNLRNMTEYNPLLISVAWMRNWFERWCKNPSLELYSLLLCSSSGGLQYLEEQTGLRGVLFPIATNPARFSAVQAEPEKPGDREKYGADAVITANYWGSKRDFMSCVQSDPRHSFALFGQNWQLTPLAPFSRGSLPYTEIPYVYRYSKIVLDDAVHITTRFGSVNSRVFDALGAGRLVLTNGEIGARDTFGGLLPVYKTPEELQTLLTRYLSDEEAYREKVEALQALVLTEHTYDKRAETLTALLKNVFRPTEPGLCIMLAVPNRSQYDSWGDSYFAEDILRQFKKAGIQGEIRTMDEWYFPTRYRNTLLLAGLSIYYPDDLHTNLMWCISHPELFSLHPTDRYRHIFIASQAFCQRAQQLTDTPCSVLLQFANPEKDYPEAGDTARRNTLLFIGNTRGARRKILEDLLISGYPWAEEGYAWATLSVYGHGWADILPRQYVRGNWVENRELHRYYSNCDILLCDTWPDMRESGFLPNRLFEALASGAFIISDDITVIQDALPSCLETYTTPEDLREKVQYYLSRPGERKRISQKGREEVLAHHTVSQRCSEIAAYLD